MSEVYQNHYDTVNRKLRILEKYRVTIAEAAFVLSFVVNFVVGKLLHVFSDSDEVYNYYNNKGNFFNQVFVKRGWGWTTAVIAVFYVLQLTKTRHRNVAKIIAGAAFRWSVATFWWVLFTQWCFGLPIMDKIFIATGGKCANISPDRYDLLATKGVGNLFSRIDDLYESSSITSYQCRKLKGTWEGGHDPSGHVFLLVHASLYLFHEIKPFWQGWASILSYGREVFTGPLSLAQKTKKLVVFAPTLPVLSLISLWWFMLLVTNMYFHSLAEKVVGLLFGYAGVVAMYYGPRWLARSTPGQHEADKAA